MRKITVGLAVGAVMLSTPALAAEPQASAEVRRPKGGVQVKPRPIEMKKGGDPGDATATGVHKGGTDPGTADKKSKRAKKSPGSKK